MQVDSPSAVAVAAAAAAAETVANLDAMRVRQASMAQHRSPLFPQQDMWQTRDDRVHRKRKR